MKTTQFFSPNKANIFTGKEIVIIVVIILFVILIGVFALLGAQTSKQDDQVKRDASKVLTAIQQYAGSNSGTYPTSGAPDINTLVSKYQLPSDYRYDYGSSEATKGVMLVNNKSCSGGPGGSVRFYLENGGSNCIGT